MRLSSVERLDNTFRQRVQPMEDCWITDCARVNTWLHDRLPLRLSLPVIR